MWIKTENNEFLNTERIILIEPFYAREFCLSCKTANDQDLIIKTFETEEELNDALSYLGSIFRYMPFRCNLINFYNYEEFKDDFGL